MQSVKTIENGVLHVHKKFQIVFFHWKGLKAPEIGKRLFQEGMMASRQGIHKFIKRFEAMDSISRKQGSGRLSKVMEVVKAIVDDQMKADEETTVFN